MNLLNAYALDKGPFEAILNGTMIIVPLMEQQFLHPGWIIVMVWASVSGRYIQYIKGALEPASWCAAERVFERASNLDDRTERLLERRSWAASFD